MYPEGVRRVDGGQERATRFPCDHPSMEEQVFWELIEQLDWAGIGEGEHVVNLGEVLPRGLRR